MDNKLSEVEDFFAQLRSKEENRVCFDCKKDSEQPMWASVNNGILCCFDCISVHRTLGNQYSMVRSTQLDMWTEKQMNLMDKGGNKELSEWF